MTLSGTLTGAAINAEFTAVSTSNSNNQQCTAAVVGRYGLGKKFCMPFELIGAPAAGNNVFVFTAQDDMQIVGIRTRVTDTVAGNSITSNFAPTDPNSIDDFLGSFPTGLEDYNMAITGDTNWVNLLTSSVTSIIGTTDTSTYYATESSFKPFLIKGISYRLTVTGVATSRVLVQLVLRQRRRLSR
jgi:hypothetical protein